MTTEHPIDAVDEETGEVMSMETLPAVRQPASAGALSQDFRTRFGTLALAQMPDEEFERRLGSLKKGAERVQRIKREMMTDGVHYGTIPNVDKPSLAKAGAEVLAMIYSLTPSYRVELIAGDSVSGPPVLYNVTCQLHLGSTDGPVTAEGVGSCNSWEKKYRYRDAERSCPKCGAPGTIIAKKNFGNKPSFVPGWLCWNKPERGKNGCGAEFAERDPAIVQQQRGRIDNPDPLDLDNTILKMAKKRAYTDAVLTGTASSDLFTQDLEDTPHDDAPGTAPVSSQPASAPAPETPRPQSPSAKITEKQRGILFGKAKDRGIPPSDFRALVDRVTGKQHTKDLTRLEMDNVLAAVEQWSPPAPPPQTPTKADEDFEALGEKGDSGEEVPFELPRENGRCARPGCNSELVEITNPDGIGYAVCPIVYSHVRWHPNGKPGLDDPALSGHTMVAI